MTTLDAAGDQPPTTYTTTVAWSPPSPGGVIAGRWAIEHVCRRCRQLVDGVALVEHAREHAGSLDHHHHTQRRRPQPADGAVSGRDKSHSRGTL